MAVTDCSVCGRPCRSMGVGGLPYCGREAECVAHVVVLYSTDAEELWGRNHLRIRNAVYMRTRTRSGRINARRFLYQAWPDAVVQIDGQGWKKVDMKTMKEKR